MEKLRQKEKQEWMDRNSTGRSPDFLPPTTTTGDFSYDCWDLRRSHIQHCRYSFLLRWPGNFEPGISFKSVVLQGHNQVFTKVEANGFDLTWSSYNDSFYATKTETSMPSKPVSKLYNTPFYLYLWSLWIQNHLWTSQFFSPSKVRGAEWTAKRPRHIHINNILKNTTHSKPG